MTKKILKLVIFSTLIFTLFNIGNVYADNDENFVIGGTHPDLPESNENNQYSQGNNQVIDTGATATTSTETGTTGSTTTETSTSSGSGAVTDPGGFNIVNTPNLQDYGPGSWQALSSNIINWLARIAGIALIVMLLVGGVMFITSAGNEEQAKKAQSVLINAIFGIIIVILAWGLITFIVEIIK